MIIINLIILVIFIVLIVKSKNYEKEFVSTLDNETYKLKQFFSSGLYILDQFEKVSRNINFTKQEESLKAIHVGESIHTIKRIYICNKIVIFALTVFAFNLLSIFSYISTTTSSYLQSNNSIIRQSTYSQMNTISLGVSMKEEDIVVLTREIDLEIQGRKYTEEELNQVIMEAKAYIDSNLLKENSSLDEIMSDINLAEYIPETELIVAWDIEDYDLISRDGKISNIDLKDRVETQITATISYYDIDIKYQIDLNILPKVFSKEELAYKRLLEELEEADTNSSSDETLVLPTNVDNMEVNWQEKKDNSNLTLLIMGVIVAVVIFFAYDKDLYEKVEERNQQVLLDYPEIINKITLLIGAGMPLKNAWHKIVQDYKEKGTEKRYAYEEMIITSNELLLGTSEIAAYEGFGRRVKLLPYLRFASLIAQNVKKGSGDILTILEIEAIESFEERKELTKRIGEKAGTKLLFPMMIMLLIVLVIVIVPAFLSFQV